MDGEERDILRGLGLAAVALTSAVLTATIVIAVGATFIRDAAPATGLSLEASPTMVATRN